jgi:hypothetical protein
MVKEHYTYDELYGTIINKNKDDTERTYFIIECQHWKFYRWMYKHGWNLIREKPCEINGLKGFKITLHKQ